MRAGIVSVVTLCALVTVVAVAPAVAAPASSAQVLLAVSCPTTAACMAVGTQGRSATTGLAEQWRAGRWRIEPSPSTGAADTTLAGVSCPSVDDCTAVGYTQSGLGPAYPAMPLAERWNGSTWRIESFPSPSGTDVSAALTGVACPATDTCVAVGSYSVNGAGEGTVAASWDGSTWKLASFPFPNGELLSVSCLAARRCEAVGMFGFQTLVYRWDGTAWRTQRSPNPTTPIPGDGLNGVGCAPDGSTGCQGVGSYGTGDTSQSTFAIGWNGTAWSIEYTPSPGNAAWLAGVSCASADFCIAVGHHRVATVGTLPLLAQWSGSGWLGQRAPLVRGSLDGVSCPTATACTAVGSTAGTGTPLIERRNGTTWTVQQPG